LIELIFIEEQKMKRLYIYLPIIISIFAFNACDINHPYDYYVDNEPPSPPSGVYVLNGDNRVDLTWSENPEGDVAGYNVYYSYSYDGKYTLIGSTNSNYFVDDGASNGNTYYYAVTAYDYNNNESELSYDVIYATPRPEGFNQSIFDYLNFPNNAGYSFKNYSVVTYDNQSADFFFENYEGTFYLDVWDDTDIQDLGPTNDIYDIEFAPTSGWSATKDEIASVGHTYIIWTWDNHFAKIRVKNITGERIVFDWAYQLVEGNTMLKHGNKTNERKPLSRTKSNRTINGIGN